MKNDEISPIVREKAPLILAEIQKVKKILLHCHPSPDPDSVGSALAMKLVLEGMGKQATVIQGDSEIPHAFSCLPGSDKIVKKNFFEINLTDHDLLIILDSSNSGMISRLRPVQFPLPIRSIVIDHHVSNESYADINLIDDSPATAFTVYRLLKVWDLEITHDIAINLLMGIYTDTGGFRYGGTDYQVFSAAAELSKIAPDYTKAIFELENSNTEAAVFYDMFALNSIKTYLNGNLVIASVSNQQLKEKNIEPGMAANSSVKDILRSVVGWNISVLMNEIEPNIIKISLRTRDAEKFDLTRLAVSLGGGGHKVAAGALLKMSIDEARDLIASKAAELYNL